MKKKEEKIGNFGKKIYSLCYGRPRYKLEISKMIYGYESKGIYPEIKKLVRNDWIKKIDIKDVNSYKTSMDPQIDMLKLEKNPFFIEPFFKNDCIDLSSQNAEKRQYYISSFKPLYNYIKNKLTKNNTTLNEEEKNELKVFMRSFFITEICENIIKNFDLKEKFIDVFSLFSENLNMYCSLVISLKEFQIDQLNITGNEAKKIRENDGIFVILSNLNPYQTKLLKKNYDYLLEISEIFKDKK